MALRLPFWLGATAVASIIHLNVSSQRGPSAPPHLHGIALDEIYHAIDGGLNGQRIEDPGLLGDVAAEYQPLNDAAVVDKDATTPLTAAITSTLKVSIPAGATGRTGIVNRAYGGFHPVPFLQVLWNSTFYVQGAFDGTMTFDIVHDGGTVYGSGSVDVHSVPGRWTAASALYQHPGDPPDRPGAHRWRLTFDASAVAGRSIHIGYPTLVDETFDFRLSTQDQPRFVRFPGGRNLLGTSPGTRWKWNETIGPWIDRPGRVGLRDYPSSDVIGLMEFLDYGLPVQAAPVLSLWSGLSVGGSSPPLTGAALQPYVDDALAELEFIRGGPGTPGGRLRARYGHPAPYPLAHVEIGYEDELHGGCASYPQRLTQFATAITRAYPDLTVIASTSHRACLPHPLPAGLMLDYHQILTEDELIHGYHLFDDYDPANPIFVGGFSGPATSHGPPGQTLQRACAEAVFMLGWERNPAVVKMGAFQTTFGRGEVPSRLPVLFAFDADTVVRETTTLVRSLLANEFDPHYAHVDADTSPGPLYWSGQHFPHGSRLKLANYQGASQRVNVRVERGDKCSILKTVGAGRDRNELSHPDKVRVVRRFLKHPGPGEVWQIEMDPFEVALLSCTFSFT